MNEAEYKIRNLESQILYLQDEHSKTLRLLHAEIKDLQMKNSETSFQLIMATDFTQHSDHTRNEDNNKLLDEIKELKTQAEFLTSQLNCKLSQLDNYEEKIHKLNEIISKLKLSHNKDIEFLETELSKKSADIVRLSTQLLNIRRLGDSKPITANHDDKEHIIPPPILHRPISPKLFKFRNQVSIHHENIHSRHRQTTARQTLLSTPFPMKSKAPSPSYPEYAISVEDKSVFSKSIKRPTILPPINPTKNIALSENHHSRHISKQDFGTDPCYIDDINKNDRIDTNETEKPTINVKNISSDPKSVEIDRFVDINNSSISPSSKSMNWTVAKNRTA